MSKPACEKYSRSRPMTVNVDKVIRRRMRKMKHTLAVLVGIMSLSIVFVENVWGNIRRLMRENHFDKWEGLE